MTIGKRIKECRIKKGMSVEELAQKLDKNRATVYRYEKGEIENLPTTILESLAKALDTTPAYIMGWRDFDIIEKNGEKIISRKQEEREEISDFLNPIFAEIGFNIAPHTYYSHGSLADMKFIVHSLDHGESSYFDYEEIKEIKENILMYTKFIINEKMLKTK